MFLIITFVLLFQLSGKVEVKDVWMRPAAKGMNSALYFKIFNNSNKPDTLYKISSALAKTVQMHETYEKGKDLMGMREIKSVVIKPHSIFEFKPRSYHVMLIGIKRDVTYKSSGEASLYFKNAGEIKVKVSLPDE